jgi:hypothetical protein
LRTPEFSFLFLAVEQSNIPKWEQV